MPSVFKPDLSGRPFGNGPSFRAHKMRIITLTDVYRVRIIVSDGMNSRQIIKELQKDGWFEVAHVGSHKQLKHPTKKGRVTVPHPKRDIPIGTLRSIEKQARVKLR